MTSSKRKHSSMERELARALTWACESAKTTIVGFDWLTHRVDYDRFPDSLIITWVFDSDKHMNAALSGPYKSMIQDLTQSAFNDIGITVADIAPHVEFDNEERCASSHGGDWARRLASRQGTGGKHGKGH